MAFTTDGPLNADSNRSTPDFEAEMPKRLVLLCNWNNYYGDVAAIAALEYALRRRSNSYGVTAIIGNSLAIPISIDLANSSNLLLRSTRIRANRDDVSREVSVERSRAVAW